MERKDMIKRIEAGESLVDICLDKYREVQCKITNDEPVNIFDVGAQTCALCHKYIDWTNLDLNCSDCPLAKAGHKCTSDIEDYNDNDSSWKKIYDMVRNNKGTKEERQNAVDDMISDLKDAKKYEVQETEEQKYIKAEQACGLKIGDTVKVTREAQFGEQGWSNSWTCNMKVGYVGKLVAIPSDDDSACGVEVKVEEQSSSYGYPYFVLEKVEKTYHIGQHFLYDSRDEYLLARIERNKVNLFNLSSGGKWSSHTTVLNDNKITEEEMKKLANRLHQWKDFTLVEE